MNPAMPTGYCSDIHYGAPVATLGVKGGGGYL